MDSDCKSSTCIKQRQATLAPAAHMANPGQKHHGVSTPAHPPGKRFLNANAVGIRVGYAASNAEHMTRVDEFLTKFVHDTQGQLMSPSTVSWRRGDKGAKLDHIITWNLPTTATRAHWEHAGGV
jgi:hypothetical protein